MLLPTALSRFRADLHPVSVLRSESLVNGSGNSTLHLVLPVPAGAQVLAVHEYSVFPWSVARPPFMLLPR